MADQKMRTKLGKYLAAQGRYQDSPLSRFLNSFSLTWVVSNLKKGKREEFFQLLEKEKFELIPDFLVENIPDFSQKFKKAILEKIEAVKQEIINGSRND